MDELRDLLAATRRISCVRVAVLLAATAAVVVLLPSSAASGRQLPQVLTAVADIGTVYWRYDALETSRVAGHSAF